MLIVHPPIAKPGECPAGVAQLSGALAAAGIPHRILDANLEGLRYLAASVPTAHDTWTAMALRNRAANLAAIREPATYRSIDRYTQVVTELSRLVRQAGAPLHTRLSLADYHDDSLVPVRSRDLLAAAERPEANPFHPYFSERLRGIFEAEAPALVGFSVNYLSQALTAFAMMGWCRRAHPRVTIVAGGGLVNSWMSAPGWRDPFGGLVDHLVAGPGEDWLIPRLAPADRRGAVGFARPAYDGLPMDEYWSPGIVAPYSAARGCFWRRCSFCPEKAEENRYEPRAEDRVLLDLGRIEEDLRPALVHFCDNAMSPRLLAALAARGAGRPWYGFTRVTERLGDPDFCAALRRSGCVMLKLGIESGHQGVLDDLGKGITVAGAERALASLRAAGIGTYVYLLFGTARESIDEARATLAFTVRNAGTIDYLNLAIFNLPAFGPDSERLERSSFYDGDLSLYAGFVHPRGFDRGAVRRFVQQEFSREPAVAAILRRTPPIFTSNHAPFFL